MRSFHYYIDTKDNNTEFKKTMRRFKINYSHKKINLFDRKYMFILIESDKAEYFQKLIAIGDIFSFNIHGAVDIFIYKPPNLEDTQQS
jgi:hypothetical protein